MLVKRRLRWAAAGAIGLAMCAPAGAWGADAPTRYSLANGCYALEGASGQVLGGGDRLRMQATTLGSYLLYRPDGTVLSALDDGSVAPAQQPSAAADWRVQDAPGQTFTLSPVSAPGSVLTVAADGAGRLADAGQAGAAVPPPPDRSARRPPRRWLQPRRRRSARGA